MFSRYVIFNKSVETEKCPEDPNFVRGWSFRTGYQMKVQQALPCFINLFFNLCVKGPCVGLHSGIHDAVRSSRLDSQVGDQLGDGHARSQDCGEDDQGSGSLPRLA